MQPVDSGSKRRLESSGARRNVDREVSAMGTLLMSIAGSLPMMMLLDIGSARADLCSPTASEPAGTFGGIAYVEHRGFFCMPGARRASCATLRACESLVPYRIIAPDERWSANGATVVEAPHFFSGADGWLLGKDLILGRHFVHAAVGWSTFGNSLLDPAAPGVHVRGATPCADGACAPVSDPRILVAFADALRRDPHALALIGYGAARRYLVGTSQSSEAVLAVIDDGGAEGVFDLALPITTSAMDPQPALAAGRFSGRVIVVNSESDDDAATARGMRDDGTARRRYRYYVVPGTPHILDVLEDPFDAGHLTTPAEYRSELRARFWQGHRWVTEGRAPPPSTRLFADVSGVPLRDASGNTSAVDVDGRAVPRPPYIELGEARFTTFNADVPLPPLFHPMLGAALDVVSFPDADAYRRDFIAATAAYRDAVGLLAEDARALVRRAVLCRGLSFTQTYYARHDEFAAMRSCDPRRR